MKVDDTRTSARFFPITDGQAASSFAAYNPKESTGSEEAIRLVKNWLDRCLREHSTCKRNQPPESYPTRLLEITDHDLRLVETSQTKISESYVALSHCWGKNANHLALTNDNYNDMCAGLARTRLPTTFRHAVEVTEKLGIRYIWIDSLCIIQSGPDKVKDWTREVRLMASVYSNSVINIAASDASNSSAGMFRDRDTKPATPLLVALPVPVVLREGRLDWTISTETKPHVFVSDDVTSCGLGQSPLDKRAWVCQERLLSVRTVHFGAKQVAWECFETPFACESLPWGIDVNHSLIQTSGSFWALPQEASMSEMGTQAPPMLRAPPGSWKEDDATMQTQRWFDVLTDFANRQLTVRDDKLPAIGAVAQQIAKSLGDEYLMGCFKSHLPHTLLWEIVGSPLPRDKTKSYLAPSWSWAKASQKVSFENCFWLALRRAGNDMQRHTFARFLDASAELVDSQNPFGQVKSGHILLWAPLVEVSGEIAEGGMTEMDSDVTSSRFLEFKLDEEPGELGSKSKTFLLPIAWRIGHGRIGGAPFMREYGLILVETQPDVFVRVGTFLGKHTSAVSKTADWLPRTAHWGYPWKLYRDVRIV
ncbi:heterokaryon incompatibility protein [Colletotrichum plurivorum]|uniref:Heterokaryon incompatibility protein n=1 Tax=Colletotrichum plurivorum TaxID=2175906 RepID=A0A8H6N843_9PEZI|nr:heterokaryon incompatibility protein [Colletotrichum plurivorum]